MCNGRQQYEQSENVQFYYQKMATHNKLHIKFQVTEIHSEKVELQNLFQQS